MNTRRAVAFLIAALGSTAPLVPSNLANADETPIGPAIVNGIEADIADHPYYAQVLASVDGQGTFFCGGSVVTPTIVLTAAHCVDGVDRMTVLTGSDRLGVGRATRVARWSLHGWRPATSQNDVALLHLADRVSVRPIKVVGPASDHRWRGSGHTLTVVGMGCTEPLGSVCNSPLGGPSDVLMRADIPSRSDAACDNDLAIWGGIDARSMLCAGVLSSPFGSHNAPNACFGDSGGPLVAEGPGGVPLLVGAVSWGANNCGDYPVAYARLASFRSWLAANGVPIDRDPFDPAPPPAFDWDASPIPGDFNGDGRTDIMWFEPTSTRHRLRVGGRDGRFLNRPAIEFSATRTPLAGDFDGDGRSDLLLDEPGLGADQMLLNRAGGWVLGPVPRIDDATLVLVGDFDGNGRDDLVRYGAGTAADQLRNGTAAGALRIGPPLNVKGVYVAGVVHDHDGDGRDDILWLGDQDVLRYGTSTRQFRVGPTLVARETAQGVVGDFDGDGRDDILWFDPGGEDLLREAATSVPYRIGPEVAIDGSLVPVGGDFDGDGVGDVLWYRAGTPAEKLWLGNPA